jgi:site-specific DNA recombinase
VNTAILYIRVSTDEQADRGYSQRNQDEVLRKYCALKEIAVHNVIYEDHSAKTFNRPEWTKMLNRLKKGKHLINLILFTKWDRFSRNTSDAYQMIALLRRLGIEPQAIEQPLDLLVPENKMMLAFYLAVPEVENDRRALNVFHGMRRARKEGRWTAAAPIGYVNKTTEDGRKYIRPDGPFAAIMKSVFADVAAGKYAVQQIWQQARRDGLKCGKSNFWKMLRNPVYAGKVLVPTYRDEPYQLVDGQHEGIIPFDLFLNVQKVLDGRKIIPRPKIVSTDMLPLRGFLACSRCGRFMTGSASRGRHQAYYHYYHCRSKYGCPNRRRAEVVNTWFTDMLQKTDSKKAFRPLIKEVLRDTFKSQTTAMQYQKPQLAQQIGGLRARMLKAMDLLLAESIDAAEYQQIKGELSGKLAALEAKYQAMPDIQDSITKLLNRFNHRLLNLNDVYQYADTADKRKLVILLSEGRIVLKDAGLNIQQLSRPFQLVYEMGI